MNKMAFRRSGALISPLPIDSNGLGSGAAAPTLLVHYFAIVRRRKWVIIGATVLALVAGLIITMLMTPKYTSTATIEIQRENDRIVNVQSVKQESNPTDLEFYQTQYGLLKAQSLAERVAADLKLQDSQAFYEMFGAPEAELWFSQNRPNASVATRDERVRKAGSILLENIDITPERLSRLVEISFTSPDAEFSRKVVDLWTRDFIAETLERRFDATTYARRFLEQRLQQLRTRLDQSERQVVQYAGSQGIVSLPSGTPSSPGGLSGERSLVAEDLAVLNRELSQATADRVRAQSRLGENSGSVTEALENSAITALRQRRAELASDYARLQSQFEPGYPLARQLAVQIEQLDRSISREEARVGSSLRSAFEAAAAREAQLRSQVSGLKNSLLDLRTRSIRYGMLQRDADTNRQLYDALLQRYKEVGIAGGIGVNNISIVDPPAASRIPSSPNLIVNMLVALIGGLAIGVGLALMLDQIDEGIADPSEVEGALGIPLLGVVPKVRSGDPVASLNDRKSALAEAYFSVQTNLAFTTDHGFPQSIAVTSTRPAEGKSTSTYAIAHSLARAGRKVLLVDVDLRSPSAHHLMGLSNDRGVSNYLSGTDDILSLIQATSLDSLHVMVAGPQPPSAAELLSSPRVEKLLAELLKLYDHVVIDAPPIMGLADAPLIASRVEATVFVIESHGTKIRTAQVALARLRTTNTQLVGTIVTKFEAKKSQYGYEYGYGYGLAQNAAT